MLYNLTILIIFSIDDDDRENDDDQVNGVEMKEMKGVQVLQDNDFDDQVCFS